MYIPYADLKRGFLVVFPFGEIVLWVGSNGPKTENEISAIVVCFHGDRSEDLRGITQASLHQSVALG